MALAATTLTRPQIVDLDKPLYTIGIAAEILATHTRTLMMYEHLGLVVPSRTATIDGCIRSATCSRLARFSV